MFQVRRQTIAEIGFYIYLQYKIGMLTTSNRTSSIFAFLEKISNTILECMDNFGILMCCHINRQ